MKKFRRTLGNFLFLWKPLWKYGKGLVIIDLLFVVVYPIRIITEVTIAQAIIEAAQAGRGAGHIVMTAVTYISIIVGLWVAREARVRFYTDWKLVSISASIEREIYEQAMKTDYRFIDSPDYFDNYKMATEEYANRVEQLYNNTVGTTGIVGSIVGLITMTSLISATRPIVLLIVLAGIAISMVFRLRLGITSNKIWKESTSDRRRMNYLTRLLYNKPANADLKSTGVGDMIIESFDKGRDGRVGAIRKYRKRQFVNGSMRIVGENFATYATMVYTALGFALGSITSIGVFTTLVAAAQNLSSTFRWMSDSITELTTMTLYAERIRGFFELETNIEVANVGKAPPDGVFELELCNVSFSYPKSDFGLKNLSIKISQGEKIAIVGENGAGKTTLSKLLLRLYDVNGGEIRVNGTPLRDYDIRALRRRIGVAMQDPQLYALSVAQNMQVYHPADDERLLDILKTVGLSIDPSREVTREFDDGGVLLSGGEAQKLGLGRLMTGDFGMLLLDEPSSALDPLAEYKLTKLLFDRANGMTTIMIAHRLSSVRNADMIYLVNDGEIAERGTHNELMALGGRYFEMFTKQGEDYII